jgi:hypothetical protein
MSSVHLMEWNLGTGTTLYNTRIFIFQHKFYNYTKDFNTDICTLLLSGEITMLQRIRI